MRNVQDLIPRTKSDLERAQAAIEAGYPTVEPILSDLVAWLKDMNWPVAKELTPFLRSIGKPLVPHIWHVLQSDDEIWKYWVIGHLIPYLSKDVATQFRPELERLCFQPRQNEKHEELDERARGVLEVFEWLPDEA
jgi:hypothetical protein